MWLMIHGKISIFGKTAERWRPVSLTRCVALICKGMFGFSLFATLAAGAQHNGSAAAHSSSGTAKVMGGLLDKMQIAASGDNVPGQKTDEIKDTCLLPPLSLVPSHAVAATALAVPAKAKKEYTAGCAALRKKKTASAEKHLRNAVEKYPEYSAAWTTLGQVLAAEKHNDEARGACSQGSAVEPSYVPAYLCLAGIAAQEEAWGEVLQFSSQALQLDPTTTAIAYLYNAAANLKTNKLDEAEKSALRAAAIDKNNSEPRVHFLLAQIYEAKGDRAKEIAELGEYLKFARNPEDVADAKQSLSQLEKADAPHSDPAVRN
jgi:tetratricopeptide (TPR) repeat protein